MADGSGGGGYAALERQIARLEDIEALKKLKAVYAAYCDQGYDPDGIAGLFAEDGVWESTRFGRYEGRAAIRGFMAGIGKSIVWALHYMTNPIIEVAEDGQSAAAKWLLFGLATIVEQDSPNARDAVLQAGTYEDTFVKIDGQWRFKHLRSDLHLLSNLDQGWVRQRFR